MPNQTNYTIRKGEKQPLFKAADFMDSGRIREWIRDEFF